MSDPHHHVADEVQALSTDDSLQAKILTAIEPWRSSDAEPPFNMKHLVVMAVMLSNGPARLQDILLWITDTFSYYRHSLARVMFKLSHGEERFDDITEVASWRDKVVDTLLQFELPFEGTEPDEEEIFNEFDEFSEDGNPEDTRRELQTWEMDKILGTAILHELLGQSQTRVSSKPFNFFGLPADLRMIIYEMVFAYPESGLNVSRRKRSDGVETRFFVAIREHHVFPPGKPEDAKQRMTWWDDGEAQFMTKPTSEILAPLLTSRQMFTEAMPTFYKINHFRFFGTDQLYYFLSAIPQERRKHLAHLSINNSVLFHSPRDPNATSLDAGSLQRMSEAFEMLSQITHLRKLLVFMNEDHWIRMPNAKGRKMYPAAEDIPGVLALHSIRGLDEAIFPHCPKIEKLLKADMLKPRDDMTLPEPSSSEKKIKKNKKKRSVAEASEATADYLDDDLAGKAEGSTKSRRRSKKSKTA